MYSSGKISKLEYSSTLMAALAYLMMNQQDGVGLVLFDEKINQFIPPRSNPSHLNTLLTQLGTVKSGLDTKIEPVLHEMAERIKKRGLVILISDLFDNPENILTGLKHFRHNKQEVIVFHILDRQEMEFNFNNRTRFKDMESGEEITTEPWHIRKAYAKSIKNIQDDYQKKCREHLVDYVPLFTDQSLDTALTEYIRKRKKLG